VDEKLTTYVHLLLFRCTQCGEPLIISVMSETVTLEKIDWDAFDVKCICGWLKRALRIEADKHYVAASTSDPQLETELKVVGPANNDSCLDDLYRKA
jgi:hypothetical protein